MNSLVNYGSDDEYEDSAEDKKQDWPPSGKQYQTTTAKQADANYEEVQMDLSEESDSSDDNQRPSSSRHPVKSSREENPRRQSREDDSKSRYARDLNGKSARDDYSRRDDRYRDKHRSEEDRDRDKRRERERYRDDREDRYREDKEDRHREDREDRYSKQRDDSRRDKRSRRSGSRERQRSRSRSPRRSEYRSRRSSSRERSGKGFSKRYDRASNKIAQLEKLGIEIKTPDCQFVTPSELQKSIDDQKKTRNDSNKDRFFMPGITGRFREQIERRKLLWQKKEPEAKPEVTAAASSSFVPKGGKIWDTVNFAQDSDGKVASKFKRLMGIRGETEGSGSGTTDVLKKQEEMFSSMEAQYEVARTATHTMRGVGLGFSSFQR